VYINQAATQCLISMHVKYVNTLEKETKLLCNLMFSCMGQGAMPGDNTKKSFLRKNQMKQGTGLNTEIFMVSQPFKETNLTNAKEP
jgi:hypothetical protein